MSDVTGSVALAGLLPTLGISGAYDGPATTDTSNRVAGRRRGMLVVAEVVTPYTPPTLAPPVQVVKAIALPDPVLDRGRPT